MHLSWKTNDGFNGSASEVAPCCKLSGLAASHESAVTKQVEDGYLLVGCGTGDLSGGRS